MSYSETLLKDLGYEACHFALDEKMEDKGFFQLREKIPEKISEVLSQKDIPFKNHPIRFSTMDSEGRKQGLFLTYAPLLDTLDNQPIVKYCLKDRGHYVDNALEGAVFSFDHEGELIVLDHYRAGRRNGLSDSYNGEKITKTQEYNYEGNKTSETNNFDGRPSLITYYDEKGKITAISAWKNYEPLAEESKALQKQLACLQFWDNIKSFLGDPRTHQQRAEDQLSLVKQKFICG